jgi:hypothetical protein
LRHHPQTRTTMKQFYLCFFAAICILLLHFNINAQISGIVFRDFNGNGIIDNTSLLNEPFAEGITVKAYGSSGAQLGTTKMTGITGAYNFTATEVPSGTPVRIEFYGLDVNEYPAFNGADNGTNVQFITAPSTAVNFAINKLSDYWNSAADPHPDFLVITNQRGLSVGGYLANKPTIIQSNSALTGPYNPANASVPATGTLLTAATQQQTGSLFGLAMQKKQQRYFATAYLRRSVEIGPQGPGGIYLLDKVGSNFSLSGSFTLQGVVPSNGGAALDFGTVTRNTSNPADDNYLSNNQNIQSRDIDAFGKAGTMSYGDIEADPNSDQLYTINLFQKRLIVFNGTPATSLLNGASPSVLSAFTEAYDIANLPNYPIPVGLGNTIRPYSVKIYNGMGYMGVVSDGINTQNKADLRGYILQFDPNNISTGFTTVVTIDFTNYTPTYWNAWVNNWTQAGGTKKNNILRNYPQPIISGIEFNENGSMDIAIKDRWGDMGGNFELNPISGGTGATQTSVLGDLLHACWTGSGWALEGTAGSCDHPGANLNAFTSTNSLGGGYSFNNTGKEWYADVSGDSNPESNLGGITKLMGSGKILSTVYDPVGQGESTAGTNYWSTMGIQYNNVLTGSKTQIARVIPQNENSLDKSSGMGDIEFLTEFQPIQIGNRIWNDINYNGIQDADETTPGLPDGAIVKLYTSTGILLATTATAGGTYYFSVLNVANDPRKPADWVGVTGILPGYDYRIQIEIPTGYALSLNDQGGNDNIDSDAIPSGSIGIIDFNTAGSNHNFDIGIVKGVLPVHRFEASVLLKSNTSTVSWTTEDEQNTGTFYVERSVDGQTYHTKGSMPAAGNSTGIKKYHFDDNISLLTGNTIIYYRVKLSGKDGSAVYSNIITVKPNTDNIVRVGPLPFSSKLSIFFLSKIQDKIQIRLIDFTGKIITESNYSVVKGYNQLAIPNLQKLATGVYLIAVVDKDGAVKFAQKITKE